METALLVAVGIVVGLVIAGLAVLIARPRAPAPEPAAPQVAEERVVELSARVDAMGELLARAQMQLQSTVNERLDAVTAQVGVSMQNATGKLSPSTAAHHGVSGAGFNTRVLPAASAGPSLARLIWCGKFHGVIAPTTPTASRAMVRRVGIPIGAASPRS